MKSLLKNVFYSFYDLLSLLHVFYVHMKGQWFRRSIKYSNHKNPLFILGNGPSLVNIKSEIQDRSLVDVCCVNFSLLTDVFYEIKPDILIFSDPGIFTGFSDESSNSKLLELQLALSERISWPIILFVPYGTPKAFDRLCVKNPNICVQRFCVSTWEIKSPWLKNFRYYLFKKGFVIPLVQNVVVGAIYCAMNAGYKNLYLFGVEHSWLKMTYVNNNNQPCLIDEHYYGNTERPWIDKNGNIIPLHKLLIYLSNSFKSYKELQGYAEYLKNVNIVNKTPNSYIDAFKRQ